MAPPPSTPVAWVQAMVEVEVALAAACEDESLIPPQAGDAILRAVQQGPFDVNAIAAEAGQSATPVIALVDELRRRLAAESPEFVDAVHFGATSQDIVDTAAMLVAQRALEPTLADARAAVTAAARLAFNAPRHAGARTHAASAGGTDLLRTRRRRMAGGAGARRGRAGAGPR